jgi:2-polyprenyl-3-methyl-5-hydroxy-6-metoxy-1,4-benzoquinol methylase
MSDSSSIERVYKNDGNNALLRLIGQECRDLLDVGCGSGDNASLIRKGIPGCEVDGITHSRPEAGLAGRYMRDCWIFDVEGPIPNDVKLRRYDAVIFSHVLEHFRNPARIVSTYSTYLKPNGVILIAVPNILSWRMRARFLRGDFTYAETGPLDNTHLRFFTFLTADELLLGETPSLSLEAKLADGGFPLWWARRGFLPKSACSLIDSWACRHWPNLFAEQILLKARKR